MKLLSLNLWGGKLFDPLISYIAEQGKTTDIFCFQEVYHTASVHSQHGDWRVNLFDELKKVLPEHTGYFVNSQEGYVWRDKVSFPVEDGDAVFVRAHLPVASFENTFVHLEENELVRKGDWRLMPRNLQKTFLRPENGDVTIFSFHGIAFEGSGKDDSPERIEQSNRVRAEWDNIAGKKILVGDFNLNPGTESLSILAKDNRNLIKEFEITSTRSREYKGSSLFADYAIVSPEIGVKSFSVPDVAVSDHLPLILEFE